MIGVAGSMIGGGGWGACEDGGMAPSEQLGFAQMPRRLFRATPTRLLSWLDCPRRYRFTYLERPAPSKGPPWAHNSLGASVHTALAGWWRLPPEARTVSEAGALLDRAWLTDGYRDAAQARAWQDRGRQMVEEYVAGLDPAAEPLGVERTVALTTPALALSGRVDRIDERLAEPAGDPEEDPAGDPEEDRDTAADPVGGTELVIVDYKSGRYRPDADDARSSLALAVYAAAASRTLRRRCARVELHHLPTGSVARWRHAREGLQRHLDRADAIGREAAAAQERFAEVSDDPGAVDRMFPPEPGPLCRWCDFAAHCPQGRAAYPTNRPWDGLDPSVG